MSSVNEAATRFFDSMSDEIALRLAEFGEDSSAQTEVQEKRTACAEASGPGGPNKASVSYSCAVVSEDGLGNMTVATFLLYDIQDECWRGVLDNLDAAGLEAPPLRLGSEDKTESRNQIEGCLGKPARTNEEPSQAFIQAADGICRPSNGRLGVLSGQLDELDSFLDAQQLVSTMASELENRASELSQLNAPRDLPGFKSYLDALRNGARAFELGAEAAAGGDPSSLQRFVLLAQDINSHAKEAIADYGFSACGG